MIPYSIILHSRVDATEHLGGTGVDDGGLEAGLDLTGAGTNSLELADNLHAVVIGNLAEDDVLAIEPAGDDGGDEELRAVAASLSVSEKELGDKSRLTCWDQRWPWRGDQAWCADA